MSFLFPAFLFGALAVAVPIVLHLLRRQADVRIPFSAVRFLRHAPVEVASHRRLRELLLLALRVGALALLAMAFARPFFARSADFADAPLTVVAVDTSYSLSAPGQMARARTLARQAVEAAPASGQIALLAFDDEARVVSAPGSAPADVLAKLESIGPGFGRTRYHAALSRAAELFGSRPGKLVVVTDLQQVGWDSGESVALGQGVEVEVADVGAPAGNVAVVALRAEQGRAIAVVRNTGGLQHDGQARLEVEGRVVTTLPFTIGPATSANLSFNAALPAFGVARVTIDDPRGYAADNVRVLLLDPPAASPILAVTGTSTARTDAFYVDRALQVDEQPRYRVDTVAASAVARLDAPSLSKYAVVFVLGSQGLDLRGAEHLAGFVKAGGGLFVAAGSQLEPALMQALFGSIASSGALDVRTESVGFVPANAHHPIMRPLGPLMGTLTTVRFRETASLPARAGWRTVAAFSDGQAALVEATLGEGRILLFASDLSNRGNDFPLHPAFVPVIHEAARYLGAHDLRSADLTPADVPNGASREPGVMAMPVGKSRGGAADSRRVAVNVDISESDMGRIDAKQFADAITRTQVSKEHAARTEARQTEGRQNLWRYGLMLMIAALVAEVAVGRRIL